MIVGTWQDLIDTVVAEHYILRSLVYAGRRQAEFQAVMFEHNNKPVSIVLMEPDASGADRDLAEINRAKQLHHPGLLHIVDGGLCSVDGDRLLFIATESVQGTLAEAVAAGEYPELKALLDDLLAGLEWLHGQGLIFRNLAPDTIVRADGRWKLADLSRLHPAGISPEPEPNGRTVPPEAAQGVISSAWDVWGLGVLLQDVYAGSEEHRPSGFEALIRGCLIQDPERRLSFTGIRKLLEPEPAIEAAPVEENIAAPEPETVAEPTATAAETPDVAAIPEAIEAPPIREVPPVIEMPRSILGEPETRRSRPWGLMVAIAVVLGAIAGFLLWPGRHDQTPQPPASAQNLPAPAATVSKPPTPVASTSATSAPVKTAAPQTTPSNTAKPAATIPVTPTPAAVAKPKPTVADATSGKADYFGDDLQGHQTASGEPFDNGALTGASPKYKLGTRLRVTNVRNGRSVTVRVNDRGALRPGFVVRVTRKAAQELDFVRAGSAKVKIQVVK
ncbi:MAG: RlpA-like double-psi beta-barrel domain-containing protein [Bryobacteraceae bacterium]